METISIKTSKHTQMLDITAQVHQTITKMGISEGVVLIYVPHTTAGITINENADPDVAHDILMMLDKLIPHTHAEYQHAEGNSDGHIKALITGSSVQIIVSGGKMQLGTWQGIYFCEFDGPRNRHVLISQQ